MKLLLANYGNLCLRSIGNVRLPTPIFGQRTQQFYPASGIEQWVKRLEEPAILSDSTTH
jgi:hypothetical protein